MAERTKNSKKRNVFQELSSGVEAMRDDREGRLELRTLPARFAVTLKRKPTSTIGSRKLVDRARIELATS